MKKPRVWITGSQGLIGHHLARLAPRLVSDLEVVPLGRSELDLTDPAALARRFALDQPELIIHCAGLTRSPQCEAEPMLARRLNVEMTARLASQARAAILVFFSSDMVFDGARGGYTELDEPNPLNVYGRTKLEAEREVLKHSRHVVLRTSLNYGHSLTGDRSFNEEMVRAANQGQTLRLFIDEFRCPIAAEVTARATWEIARAALYQDAVERPAGIIHLTGSERLSRWAIGELLAERHPELRGRIQRESRREYTGAPRPADTSMDCARARKWLSFPLPAFSQWMADRGAEPERES